MFSNAFAVLDKAEDRDADGFQTVGDGRRKRNQVAKQARPVPYTQPGTPCSPLSHGLRFGPQAQMP